MLSILYYFIKISHLIGLIFCFLGFVIGLIKGFSNATFTTNSYYPVSIQLKLFYVNYYNFIVEYINQISYCIILFSIIFYFMGIILPIGILIYMVWKILQFLNKFIK
jgi:hypothetical protein